MCRKGFLNFSPFKSALSQDVKKKKKKKVPLLWHSCGGDGVGQLLGRPLEPYLRLKLHGAPVVVLIYLSFFFLVPSYFLFSFFSPSVPLFPFFLSLFLFLSFFLSFLAPLWWPGGGGPGPQSPPRYARDIRFINNPCRLCFQMKVFRNCEFLHG